MSLLELLVLALILAGDLLVLLTDNVRLCTSVLVLQCLLIVKLLFDLSFNGGGVDIAEERNELLSEEFVERVSPLFE